MKYLLIALVAIAIAVGFMVKHSNEKREELAAQALAHKQKLEQEQQQAQRDLINRQMEKQGKAAYYAELAEQAKNDYAQSVIDEEKNKVAMIEKRVRDALLDPSSAQFRNQNGNCGEVNAKNRMGGYIGFNRYVYVQKTDHVIVGDKDNEYVVDALWNAVCRK